MPHDPNVSNALISLIFLSAARSQTDTAPKSATHVKKSAPSKRRASAGEVPDVILPQAAGLFARWSVPLIHSRDAGDTR